jgi:hypothetical protein
LGERLVCNQEVTGSIPVSSTRCSFFDKQEELVGSAVGRCPAYLQGDQRRARPTAASKLIKNSVKMYMYSYWST